MKISKKIPKPLCFYDEFPFYPRFFPMGSLKDVLGTTGPDESSASYLENGVYLITAASGGYDVFQPDKWISIGAYTGIQTDGDWFWSSLLPYYVRNFGVPLPDEFLECQLQYKEQFILSNLEKGQLFAAIRSKYYPGWIK